MKLARKQFLINEILTLFHLFSFSKITIGLILSLILSSCEFSPGDIKETFIEKPSEEPPMIGFELTPETDTLRLYEPVTIKYKFNASPRKIHSVEFSLDGAILFSRDYGLDNLLEMDLNPHQYSEGLHTLKINVVTSSNSGSIADKVKAEGYSYQFEWPVLIDFTPPKMLRILSVTKQPGGVLIKWEKFPHAAFKRYLIEKTSYFEFYSKEIAVITDPYTTEYFDTDYLEGEKVTYGIYLNGLPGYGISYSEPPGLIKVTYDSKFKATVNWEPTRNPQRLDYYRISLGHDNTSPGTSHDEKHILFGDKNEVTFEMLGLGTNTQINLQNIPRTTDSHPAYSSLQVSSTVVAIGNPIPVHELTKKVYGTNYTLMNNGNKLILYDHENRQRMDSLDFGSIGLRAYRITPDGKVVYTLTGNNLQAWEIVGFRKLGSIDLNNINSRLSELYDISVSSDSKIIFTVSGEKIVVYDFKNDKVLIAPDQSVGWAKISPDGKHIVTRFTRDSTYYRDYDIESNQLILKGEMIIPWKDWGNYCFFSRPDLDQLIYCRGKEVQVRRTSDFSLVNKFSIGTLVDFDPETNLLILAKGVASPTDECYIANLPSGEIIKTVFLAPGSVILHRDFLIGRNGRQLNLSNL